MASVTVARATLDDLYRTEGKAELVGGRIVYLMATGWKPNLIAGRIFRSLADHADRTKAGKAFTDNMGYTVPELPSGRESFAPDASYYEGPPPLNPMRFIEGPPRFAVEVRSEHDYSEAAEKKRIAKRTDYFRAGTLVVWDVDPEAECIHVFRRGVDEPTTYIRGQQAEAEPAVAGWQVPVDWIFAE